MKPILEIKNLNVSYDRIKALENANLEVSTGDFLGVIGPNGGGKTTLLKAILGLVKPTSGTIRFHFKKPGGNAIGYLPQINQVDKKFPITVLDVVRSGKTEGMHGFHFGKSPEIKKALSLLNEMGIENISRKAIGELSGGQMQRVFLCRALMSDPELLILDEPDSFVDNNFESELYEKLRELNKRMAIMLVSHDVGTIAQYVKTIACVNLHLHYHPSNKITTEQLASYNCPLQIITHGQIPHTVLKTHDHEH
ncbi:MAG: zinc ABC transporter ATP-binding protein [Bacteroidetes bacterium GWF2_42_66]|nr:MAG: zinc ABC transporter ATP-binding protein [Bacteroidetes bacterium GWA2_42_15]OFX95995.1 MAG: zinc ABC transporter ATP-binding protein [Bacteroidetes bacterium GWE2_42_39]OFY46568.1 MAG: zinc ABC transporter ATP-binding protein [Bacteroidetes bacterium GWF2_42_66]HBL75575.1 zinc ABC transporter ATP-binding protein [Prolixibacteraceae bacterium]HCR91055.1 zinc ABC transporter ATP-binding protein [Prolixibacteraceae bacterium]